MANKAAEGERILRAATRYLIRKHGGLFGGHRASGKGRPKPHGSGSSR